MFFTEPEEVVETEKPWTPSPVNSFRRILEITAEEIRAMALPELLLLSLQDGMVESLNEARPTEDPEDRGMDSCEEVDEEAVVTI
ncbi:hypothetical protein PBY51_016530 [Eleginops maclovinus]|uniref:Uncharacterized protein n=1 Tax=Eleginops maclovinus TaxID=56733 RepID=A0AAN7WK80_ELEMC|nr:hypothetical protein PBY51_016530 [Eleginops maclovinus]